MSDPQLKVCYIIASKLPLSKTSNSFSEFDLLKCWYITKHDEMLKKFIENCTETISLQYAIMLYLRFRNWLGDEKANKYSLCVDIKNQFVTLISTKKSEIKVPSFTNWTMNFIPKCNAQINTLCDDCQNFYNFLKDPKETVYHFQVN